MEIKSSFYKEFQNSWLASLKIAPSSLLRIKEILFSKSDRFCNEY